MMLIVEMMYYGGRLVVMMMLMIVGMVYWGGSDDDEDDSDYDYVLLHPNKALHSALIKSRIQETCVMIIMIVVAPVRLLTVMVLVETIIIYYFFALSFLVCLQGGHFSFYIMLTHIFATVVLTIFLLFSCISSGRPFWSGWPHVPQHQGQLAVRLQTQHSWRQGAHPGVLLSPRVPRQP